MNHLYYLTCTTSAFASLLIFPNFLQSINPTPAVTQTEFDLNGSLKNRRASKTGLIPLVFSYNVNSKQKKIITMQKSP